MNQRDYLPDSGFAILLDSKTHMFEPGDIVSGMVYAQHLPPGFVDAIQIILLGRSKVEFHRGQGDEKRTVCSKAPLVYEIHPLYPSSEGIWPFSITLPTRTRHLANIMELRRTNENTRLADPTSEWNQEWKLQESGFQGWHNAAFHPLPPTLRMTDPGTLVDIGYTLNVIALNLRRDWKGKTIATPIPLADFPLRISAPTRSDEELAELVGLPRITVDDAKVKTFKLLPDRAHRGLSIQQRLGTTLRPNSVPELQFRVNLVTPRIVFTGSQFEVRAIIEATPETPPNPNDPYPYVPKTHLRSLRVRVNRQLWTRGGPSDGNADQGHLNTYEALHQIHNFDQDEGSATSSSMDPISVTCVLPPLSPDLMPTFATFNAACVYEFNVEVVIECAHETTSIKRQMPFELSAPVSPWSG